MSWLPGWAKRIKLTIDQNDITAALSNFPVLIYLSTSSGRDPDDVSCVFDEVGANSLKIAVTEDDGVTECYVEVEKWDLGNEKAWLWAKIPTIASDADTDIYLYYDNTHADNDSYVGNPNDAIVHNVWDANFKLVTHMQNDPDNQHVRDSTDNDNDGTKGAATHPNEVDSQIGKGQEWNAKNEHIDPATDIAGSTVTLETWYKFNGTGGSWNTLFCRDEGGYHHLLIQDATNLIGFWLTGPGFISSGFALNPGQTYYIVLIKDGTNSKLYIDMDLKQDSDSSFDNNSYPVGVIGNYKDDGTGTQGSIGVFDEVRASSGLRTVAWLNATHESGLDDLLDFGNEEYSDSIDLPAQFTVAQGKEDLLSRFEVGQGSQELFGKTDVRHSDSADLACQFSIIFSESVVAGLAESLVFGDTLLQSEDLQAQIAESITFFPIKGSANAYAQLVVENAGSAEAYAHLFVKGIRSADTYAHLVVRNISSADAYAHLIVKSASSANAYAHLIVKNASSANAYAHLIVRNIVSADAYAHLVVKNASSANAYAHFIVKNIESANVYAHLIVKNISSADAYAHLIVKNVGSTELLGKFEAQATTNIYAHLIVRNIGSADAYAHIIVRNIGSSEAYAHLIVKNVGSAGLLGKADIRHVGTPVELFGKLDSRQTGSAEAYAHFIVKNVGSVGLLVEVIIRHPAVLEVFGRVVIRHIGTPIGLLSRFTARHSHYLELHSSFEVGQDSQGLPASFEVGQDSQDLPASFEVGQDSVDLSARSIIRHSTYSDLKLRLYVRPEESLAAEMTIGGRDRRLDLGGIDREMVIGGRQRRMKIK